MARTALILGTDNQDGAYLARLLLARGYQVHGVADNAAALSRLGVDGEVEQHSRADAHVVDAVGADEVYDLRGPGWSRLADTRQLLGTLRGRPVRLFSAGPGADDDAVRLIDDARNDGLFAVTGRLFPHESRLGGGNSSVTRIIDAAFRGYMPAAEDLAIDVDCGWAPEYVNAMWRMLQQPRPLDFTLATGRLLGGAETAGHAFVYFNRDPSVIPVLPTSDAVAGDPGPARAVLGWSATTWGRDLVRTLCDGLAEQGGAWT